MLVFHGGLTNEQIQLLYEDEYMIFDTTQQNNLFVSDKKDLDNHDDNNDFTFQDEIFSNMECDPNYNQYFYFSKYLSDALEFCDSSNKQNYILVADIDEELLKHCIRCSRKAENKIEFRVPRKCVKLDTIHEVLYFEPYNEKQLIELKNKYSNHFSFKLEKDKSEENIKQKQRLHK